MNMRRKQTPQRRSRRDQRNRSDRKKVMLHNREADGFRNEQGLPPPEYDQKQAPNGPPHGKPNCPPKHPFGLPPITLQKAVLLAAILNDWLIIETVIINRNKTAQVILAGDFGKFGIRPEFLNEENIGLFEALEDTGLFPSLGGEEVPPEAQL